MVRLNAPNGGVVEFDLTYHLPPKDKPIMLGSQKDYNDIPPLKGVAYRSVNSTLSVMGEVKKAEDKTNFD